MTMIRYHRPSSWVKYDLYKVLDELVAAKASVLALTEIPSQRSWAEHMQLVQLKREVAGTSRIEGADFTERELDDAMKETPEQLHTRSQRQAAAAVSTYRWIASLPDDLPISEDLVREVHRRIVTGADDDHCPPGQLREKDQNVHFGIPRHRGCEGGRECQEAFSSLMSAVNREFRDHDPLIQALMLHYHFAAMHPFLDGNGRTARAVEALSLQRTGLRDTLFVAMSNYYYEEKTEYLNKLAQVRSDDHDLTCFIKFGLKGVELQCKRLLFEIRKNVRKALFRNIMFDLFGRLKNARKRVVAERQLELLKYFLEVEECSVSKFFEQADRIYRSLANPDKAAVRDISNLLDLGAINFKDRTEFSEALLVINLDWPTTITETDFFRLVKKMPRAKTHQFLSSDTWPR